MNTAVTGATGFLGRYLVAHLVALGHSCRCWHRSTSDRGGFEELGSRVQWVPGELGDVRSTRALVEGTRAVVHAALYHPGGGFRGYDGNHVEFVERNVIGTLKLIDAARRAGVGRFIVLSSCAVHEVVLADRPLDENHPTRATSLYGAHKAAIEQFVHSYGLGEGYAICALRPVGIYGLARPVERSKWFDLVQAIVYGQDVQAHGGGKEVHARDVARAIGLLLTAPQIAGQVYNCCDRYVSHFEVASLAKRISGSSSHIYGEASTPKHQIVTERLRQLGMEYGETPLLEETLGQLVTAAQARDSGVRR